MPKQLPSSAVVVEGDIERRIISVYTPDYYKDDPKFGTSLEILKNSVPLMDYLFEKANALPQLVDIDMCPVDLLSHLAALLGYKWKPDVDGEVQRKEIAKLVSVYNIRGTALGVIRIVLNAGALYGEVFTPYEHLFRLSVSRLSGEDRFEAGTFWRWGVYEVVTDVDFAKVYDDLLDVHPAGTKWYGRQLVQIVDEDQPAAEIPTDVYIYHVDTANYCDAGAENYDDSVLLDLPNGYWKLDEPFDLKPATSASTSQYGTARYDISTYSGASVGLPANDSSPNALTARYNSEAEQVFTSNGVTTNFGTKTLLVTPVIPGTVHLVAAGLLLTDDGNGHFMGDGTGSINYTTGVMTGIQFNSAPGAGSTTLPTLLASDTLPTVAVPPDAYWHGGSLSGATGDKVASWPDSSTNARTAANTIYAKQPTLELNSPVTGHKCVKFSTTNELTFTNDALGTAHTIFAVVRFDGTSTTQYILSNVGATAGFWYDGTNGAIRYDVSSPNSVNAGTYVPDSRWYILTINRLSTSTASITINGFPLTTLSLGTTGTFSATRMGTTFNGAIATLLTYPASLSAADQLSIEEYLGQKYNLQNQLYFWADTDAITGVTTGTAINGQWQSSGVSRRVISQVTSSRQPVYVTGAANGHAAVEFDGSGTQDVLTLDANADFGTAHTIFASFQLNTIRTGGDHYICGSSSCGLRYTENGTLSTLWYIINAAAASTTVQLTAGRVYTLAIARTSTTVVFYLDGVQISSSQAVGVPNTFVLRFIGGQSSTPTTNLYGRLFFLSAYVQTLGQQDLTAISRHLMTKYATLTEPVSAVYNDYVIRGIDGAISHSSRTAARFGFQVNLNKACVILPASDLLKPRKKAYSVEAWIRVPVGEGGTFYGNRWSQGAGTFQIDARVNLLTGVPEFYVGAPVGSNEYFIAGPKSLWDNSWHHIVAELEPDTNTMVLYVDGLLVASTNYTTPGDMNASGNFLIGALSLSAPEHYFRGDIDEVAVYSPSYGMRIIDRVAETDKLTKSQPSNPKVWVGELITVRTSHSISRRITQVTDTSLVSDRVVVHVIMPNYVTVIDSVQASDVVSESY